MSGGTGQTRSEAGESKLDNILGAVGSASWGSLLSIHRQWVIGAGVVTSEIGRKQYVALRSEASWPFSIDQDPEALVC
jgi:hypothetical protein